MPDYCRHPIDYINCLSTREDYIDDVAIMEDYLMSGESSVRRIECPENRDVRRIECPENRVSGESSVRRIEMSGESRCPENRDVRRIEVSGEFSLPR
eukprot:COSAG02_NODE_3110_length_7343_cov_14.255936_1_plen_97_part_00